MKYSNLFSKVRFQARILCLTVLLGLGCDLWHLRADGLEQIANEAEGQNRFLVTLLDGPENQPVGLKLAGVLFVVALATLVTEDLTCVVTGLMIANGTFTWTQGIGACLFGILFGDFLLYLAGRRLGRPALRRIPLRWMIDPIRLSETEDWFRRRGGLAILISRFVPGTRLPAYVAAGLLGVPTLKFLFYFVLAAVLWTPALIWIAYHLADEALRGIEKYNHAAPWILLGLGITYLLLLKIMVPAMNWRGRRLLVGRWRRLTRPEYWPTRILYLPVFGYLTARWLRPGKHPMDFSACNPCIPGAGMVEESKKAILDGIQDRSAVAEYALIPQRMRLPEKLQVVDDFIQEHALQYPVVLKPDVGERGNRVVIAENPGQVRKVLRDPSGDFIVQAFVPGVEFGVFYIRRPSEESGRIFAITRKTFSFLKGDGLHNLEELILADPRAVCQSEIHFKNLQERLFEVPAAGERIQLNNVGNHCLGTLFEDGMELWTPELEKRVDEISRSLPGFFFGRYDLFAPDEAAFQRGEALKVIELNGVSSEATSMYDPQNSYLHMVKTLLKQWETASAIGLELQKQGHPRMTLRELIRHYDRHQRRAHRLRIRLARKRKTVS